MKSFIFTLLLFTLPFMISAQQNGNGKVFELINSTKTRTGNFESVAVFKSKVESAQKKHFNEVKAGVIVEFDNSKVQSLLNRNAQEIQLDIPINENGEKLNLELVQVDIFAPGFSAKTSDGKELSDRVDMGKHYRGVIAGKSNSLVSLSIYGNQVIGFVANGEANYIIGKLKTSEKKHIIYKDVDLTQINNLDCATENDNVIYKDSELVYQGNSEDVGDCVNIYIEAGQSVYNSFGGNLANTTAFLNGLFAQSYTLYANEGITMQTSDMFVWTTADPYNGADSDDQLLAFQTNTAQGAFNGDLGHLVEVENFGGLAAGFSGICNADTDESLCYSGLEGNTYADVPVYSFNVYVITHEMGHLLGSRHTHACVWNGNGTAIDGCSGFTEGACPLPGSPAGGGTIMSYCHNDPVGIDFTQGFGPQPNAVILNTVNAPGNCLTSCSACNVAITSIVSSPGVTCGNTGTIDVTATSSNPPISYTISGPVTATNSTGSFSGLPAGTYLITVNDALPGCSATGTATLITDTTPPVITCPPSQVLTCFEGVPNKLTNSNDFIAAGGTISDNCPGPYNVFSTETTNGGDNCPGNPQIVIRTYYVQDAAGNISSCTQTFTYLESTQGPVITSVLPTCYKYCGSLANPAQLDITYTTDCSFDGVVTITGPQQIGPDNCPGTIYRYTYTVTDDCGRTSAPVTRDFIIGNDGPTIQCPSYSLLLECGDPNNTDYIAAHLANVSANTSCELGYTINHFPSNFNNITCNTTTVVTFVATDNCGRTATCTTIVNISDNTAPVITSTYVDGVCNEAVCGSNLNFWFANWKSKVLEGLSATDACDSNISWTTSPNSNSPNQDCPDGTAETTVTWFANDNCGNAGEISYTFYVVPAQGPDPVGQIMGIVATEETETVENVAVSLEGNSNVEMYETTEDGLYSFGDLTLEENYTVTPYLNENPLNGVSSFDLVLIAKHILQSELLDSPYKIIAADINQSGSVTTIDIVELRKLILHINEEFPNNTSWRFIESAFIFPVPTNPFASVFPEAVYINGLTEEEQHDFVGVKVGDVNGSAVANAMAAADDRTVVGDLVFQIADQQLKAGESYDVVFHADNFEAVHGYQFSLNFDEAVLKFANISAGELTNLNENNFGLSLLEKGVITTSWTNQQAQSLARNAEVFHVTFVAKADALLSDVLHVSSQYTKAEAYNANLELMDVQLRFDGDAVVTNQFRLYQNTPNPFKQETVIRFDLPEASKATLLVYDVSGKLLKQVEGDFVKGYNSIPLSNDGLSPGLLHYQLVTPTGTASMKMILQ